MKNMIKKNQMMITALAIMIAVAGYLNFAGTKVTDEDLMSVSGEMGGDRAYAGGRGGGICGAFGFV